MGGSFACISCPKALLDRISAPGLPNPQRFGGRMITFQRFCVSSDHQLEHQLIVMRGPERSVPETWFDRRKALAAWHEA
ncbi:hypothetical protein BDW74DRAFT_162409 [Aspergillus multicolor]|uniref:uncharacterized protein n=1 Tax=Aspergillus multicolor TaxID=41759 RepID=UPI003CCDEDD7